jgi:hypothetical protein
LHFFDETMTLEKVRRYGQRDLLLALLRCSQFDNAKIQVRVLDVFMVFVGVCLAPAHLYELPSNVPEYIAAKNKRTLERNRVMIEDLLAAGASSPHWRYELMICAALLLFCRADDPDVRVVRFLAERLVSDVPQIREIATTAVTLVLKRHSHQVASLAREWSAGTEEGVFFDKPWEGFSGHRFLHKRKAEEPVSHACVVAVHEFLGRAGVAEKIALLSSLDSSSSVAASEARPSLPSHISMMLRSSGVDVEAMMETQSSKDKTIVIDNLEQMWPLTPVACSLGHFHLLRALFWKSLVKSYNLQVPEYLIAVIQHYIHPSKTREENAVAMEMIAGAMRATKTAPEPLLQILKSALLSCSNGNNSSRKKKKSFVCNKPIFSDAHYDFLAMLRFGVYNRDPRRFRALIDMVFSFAEQTQNASSSLAKAL